ncbi:MAG: DUF3854 domain-containing protein [Acidobacteria bacterium]|nr:DUF3854 domain-containing protein [Acidobacteriota bacterium]
MSAASVLSVFAELVEKPLTADDHRNLARRWLRPEDAATAGLHRVDGPTGAYLMGSPRKSFPGICIPYRDPETGSVVLHRIRVDDSARPAELGLDGKRKESPKYQGAYGSRNHAYFPPGVSADHLADASLDVVITEGEFKTLALWRLANHESAASRFLPVGLSGVWNWKGKIGRRTASDGTREDDKGVISDLRRMKWEGRRVVIAFDADLPGKPLVEAARRQLSREIRSAGAVVAFLPWPADEGKGIDDRLAGVGPEKVLAELAALDWDCTTGWKAKLRRTDNDKPKALLLNVDIALRHAPEWEGVFCYNELRQQVQVIEPPPIGGAVPRDWNDADDTATAIWMQIQGLDVGRDTVGPVVQALARGNTINPLRDWLNEIVWDGTRRVDSWLVEYFGVAESNYAAAVGRMWLISAVARVMKPGCQVDHMLVLEGDQGLRKSTALRALAGSEYFSDAQIDLQSKDSQLHALRYWIIEWGELDALRKAEVTAVKAFITRQTESFRRPYGHYIEDNPRQCVFAGSTNRSDYLRDETGGRRFWPVKCARADAERIAADREQLWAEAVVMFKDGAKWWPERAELIEEITAQQAERMEADPWQPEIERYVEVRDKAKAEDILRHLGIELSDMDTAKRRRVGKCLRECGFNPTTIRESGQVVRCFVRVK